FGHDQISVYGIGKELDANQWRSIYRQLIARNLLSVDIEGHGNLRLTEQCRPVLRGDVSLQLRKENKQSKSANRGRKSFNSVKDADKALWEALRTCRKTLADQADVPPYVIFHDATLMEMLERQPQTHDQFSKMTGVGEKKLEAYANQFLEVIKQHIKSSTNPTSSSETIEETLLLLRSGMNANEIATHRNLKITTIFNHLAQCIEMGELELQQAVDLSEQEIKTIQNPFLSFSDEDRKLKPVYEAFEGAFDYGLLQCVRASVDIPM
ncbi:MAG: HRDC domain-containing protein, partial [Gammaproteobacteria bacterium]|nr:HRDC domain-containing protein [Gammaproteobacteria bacterium]